MIDITVLEEMIANRFKDEDGEDAVINVARDGECVAVVVSPEWWMSAMDALKKQE